MFVVVLHISTLTSGMHSEQMRCIVYEHDTKRIITIELLTMLVHLLSAINVPSPVASL